MIVNSAYTIQSNLLIGNPSYTPNYMFIEFKNMSSPGTVTDVVVPTATETAATHYTKAVIGAAASGHDYIAVPITLKPRIVTPTGTNHAAVEYSVVTSGITKGVLNNLDFGDTQQSTNNSTIYSIGLITRLKSDGTDDILFARTNLTADQQMLKTTSDMYITWKIEL